MTQQQEPMARSPGGWRTEYRFLCTALILNYELSPYEV
jgi:hypothetical protein